MLFKLLKNLIVNIKACNRNFVIFDTPEHSLKLVFCNTLFKMYLRLNKQYIKILEIGIIIVEIIFAFLVCIANIEGKMNQNIL